MDGSQVFPAHRRIFSDEIAHENDNEIGLLIGMAGSVRIVQVYHKHNPFAADEPCTLYVVDEDRRLTVYMQALYLP